MTLTLAVGPVATTSRDHRTTSLPPGDAKAEVVITEQKSNILSEESDKKKVHVRSSSINGGFMPCAHRHVTLDHRIVTICAEGGRATRFDAPMR